MPKTSVAAAVAIGMLASAAVPGATKTTTMGVTASLADTCMVSASALMFPAYVAGSGTVTGSATLTVRCSNGAIYAVGLGAGSTPGTTFAQRLLASGTHTLQYNLYVSNSYSTVWGDGTGGTAVVGGTSTGFAAPDSLTVYGQLPDSANNKLAPPGAYGDTILVVLSY
jgi:spore coat protein U-like protein